MSAGAVRGWARGWALLLLALALTLPAAGRAQDAARSALPSHEAWVADASGRAALFEAVAGRVESLYWDPDHLDWRAWRARHRDAVVGAADRASLDRAFRAMFADLGDEHSRWLGRSDAGAPRPEPGEPPTAPPDVPRDAPTGEPASAPTPRLGAEVRPLPGQGLLLLRVHPGGAADAAGLRRGDVIVAVEDVPLDEPGIGWGMHGMLARALRSGPVAVTIDRPHGRVSATVAPGPVPAGADERPLVEATPALRAARLEIPAFVPGTAELVHAELARLREEGVEALVLDVRGNPGGGVAEMGLVLGAFVEGSLLIALGREGRDWTLEVRRDANLEVRLERGTGGTAGRLAAAGLDAFVRWDGPLAVLVDGGTASAAEAFAGVLAAAAGAVIVGSDTPGNVETIRRIALPGGHAAMVAVGDLRLTDGSRFAPVPLDAVAELDPRQLARGLDAPYAEAIRRLRGLPVTPGRWF